MSEITQLVLDLQPVWWFIGGMVVIVLFFRTVMPTLREIWERRVQESWLKKKLKGSPFANFNSMYEFLAVSEQGLSFQLAKIQEKASRSGIDPSNESSYKTVKEQYEQAHKWRVRIESNPVLAMLDRMLFPVAKHGLTALGEKLKAIA